MFCGTFDSRLDKRGRLTIPVGLGDDICGERLFLKEGEDDCVEIHTEAEPFFAKNQEKNLFAVKCDKSKRMITIPAVLLRSNSFYFGKEVTLVGEGTYIRIWPRFIPKKE